MESPLAGAELNLETHVLLQVLPQVFTAARLTGTSLEPSPAFHQRPPDGFRPGLMGQVGHFVGQPFDVNVF
jgi:hypothetical protein